MNGNKADTFIQNITSGRIEKSVKFPEDDDLEGAAVGLLRLQDTYKLKTSDLANGFVGASSVGKGLNAHDCGFLFLSFSKDNL
jgi:prolyl 4-hydroxylase